MQQMANPASTGVSQQLLLILHAARFLTAHSVLRISFLGRETLYILVHC